MPQLRKTRMCTSQTGVDPDFLVGGGEMGALMRAHDWAATDVGPPTNWPQSLRTAVRLMLNTEHQIAIFWGSAGTYFYNDAVRRSLGPEQHPASLGMRGSDVWARTWDALGPQVDQALSGRGSTWHENQLLPFVRNGALEDAWFTYSFAPIDDEQAPGGIGGVLVLSSETTVQMQLSKRLAASEQRLQQALSVGRGIGTWDWDMVQDRVVANERFARLYGVDPTEAAHGAPIAVFFSHVHPDDLDNLYAKIAEAHGNEQELRFEYRLIQPDGRSLWVLAEGRCEHDAQGRPLRMAGISFDITERKLSEARLRDSEAHYRSVVTALQEGIVVTAADGRILSCNPAAERIVGSDWSEWRTRGGIAPGWQPLRDDGAPMPWHELPWARVLAGDGPQADVELNALDPQGRTTVFEVSAVPVLREESGALISVVAAFTDVTARRRADRELQSYREGLEAMVSQRTADLEVANAALAASRDAALASTRAKSAFLSNMSHEIRTPMNAIIGLTHLMSREVRDTGLRQRLAKVNEAAQHLLGIINDILDLSKVEAGRIELESVEFDLPDLVARATGLIAQRAHDKGLQLLVDIKEAPARLVGDPTRVAQMLINLLSNAEKFTAEGSIRVVARTTEIREGRIRLRVEVQDTGLGVPLGRQAELFSPFTQTDSSISRQHGGTGLGLALTRQLATAMGGEAGVTSVPGTGSTFWFCVWLDSVDEAPAPFEALPLEGLRALLVDNDFASLVSIGQSLRDSGLSVDLFGSGVAALKSVESATPDQKPYDIVVAADKMIPWDSAETIARMRQLFGTGMPLCVLVASTGEAVTPAPSFDAVLHRPTSDASIRPILEEAMLRRRSRSRATSINEIDDDAQLRHAHAGQRVLLAEDNAVSRELAQELLASTGLVVESAINGAQAVELALSRPYDLIFMDIQMPVMDGFQASHAIRAAIGPSVPIVAMTAYAFSDDRANCLSAGMDDHISKPVDPANLYRTLLKWLPTCSALHGR